MNEHRPLKCFRAASRVANHLIAEERKAKRNAPKPDQPPPKRRSKQPALHWTAEQRKEAAALVESGMSQKAVARKFGVSQGFISSVVAAQRRKAKDK